MRNALCVWAVDYHYLYGYRYREPIFTPRWSAALE